MAGADRSSSIPTRGARTTASRGSRRSTTAA
jgi:hypothetical protein